MNCIIIFGCSKSGYNHHNKSAYLVCASGEWTGVFVSTVPKPEKHKNKKALRKMQRLEWPYDLHE